MLIVRPRAARVPRLVLQAFIMRRGVLSKRHNAAWPCVPTADQGLNALLRYDFKDKITSGIPTVSWNRTWTFQPSAAPQAMALSTNGRYGYVSLNASATVAVFDLNDTNAAPIQVRGRHIYSCSGMFEKRRAGNSQHGM